MKRVYCATCGHAKTKHADPLLTPRPFCVGRKSELSPACRCTATRREVETRAAFDDDAENEKMEIALSIEKGTR